MLKFWKNKSRLGFGSKSQQQSSATASKGKSETVSIKTGERIVYIGEQGPEHGTVKWIGYLPDKGKKPLAGVEFDKPPDGGIALYSSDELFQAKSTHSALLPVDKLYKEKEFQERGPGTGSPSGMVASKPKKKWLPEFLNPTASKQQKILNQQNKKDHAFYQSKEQLQTEEKEECAPTKEPETIEPSPVVDYVYEPLNVTNTKAATTATLRTSVAPTTLKKPASTENITNSFVQPESLIQPEQESPIQQSMVKTGLNEVSNCEPIFSSSDDSKAIPQAQPLVRKSSLHGTNLPPTYSLGNKQTVSQSDGHSTSERSKFFESLSTSNSPDGAVSRTSKYNQKPEVQQHEVCCTGVVSSIANQFQELNLKDLSNYSSSQNKTGTNKIRHPSPSAVRRRSSSAQESSGTGYPKIIHNSDRVVKSEPRITTSSSESLSKPVYSAAQKIGEISNADFETSYLKPRYKANQDIDFKDFPTQNKTRRESASENFGIPQEKLDFYVKKNKPGLNVKKEFLPSPNEYYSSTPSELRHGEELHNSYDYSEHLRTPTETDYVTPSPEAGNGFTFNDIQKLGSGLSSCSSESPEPEIDFEVGSVVEVTMNEEPRYGVIRWIGHVPGKNKLVAGIEMEEEADCCSNGIFGDIQYFSCPDRKGFFTFLSRCHKDSRFLESLNSNREGLCNAKFGSIDCPVVSGDIPPLSDPDHLLSIFGKNRGIQGHHNSCYLDATLFSMFSFTSVFDSLLHRPPVDEDIVEYREVQRVLKEEIVNPLRQNFYVRADRVMKLRTLLEKLSSVTGLTCEEKDPEEFLNSLLHQILKAEPFLKLSSGQETYFYQLFVEKNENIKVPSVQQLFDQSFLTSDIKLKEIPSCLIIQMPRFGKQFKMYSKIFPSQVLDITDVLENSPRQCDVCGELAEFECRDCYHQVPQDELMKAFCRKCNGRVHSHQHRGGHGPRKISVPDNFNSFSTIPRVFMDLFAVVCIETSHYVAFVKCGNGPDAPWCFFDSMADRKGERYGYNIPEIVSCPHVLSWLSAQGHEELEDDFYDKQMPELAKRLFSDAYMCMYQSSDIMMYR